MQFKLCSKCFTPSLDGIIICPNCGVNLKDLPSVEGNELEGAVFEDRYQLDYYLDEGAMAWVYKGIHMELGSSVAIKILKPSFQSNKEFLARFKKEAMAASALNHPNILSIITSGTTSSGITYIISEFIKGISLAGLISKEGKLPLDRTVRIIGQVLSALDEAHNKGIVHRDIKPENIMVTTLRSGEDFVKLVDFGIARETNSIEPRLTKHGEIFGTPEYMAPEVIKGKEATAQSDIYAIGIIAYELLSGILPFRGDVIFDVLKAHLENTPESLTIKNSSIPLEIDAMILSAMDKDPEKRPSNAMAFKNSLQDKFNASKGYTKCNICNHIMESTHRFCPNCGSSTDSKTISKIPQNSIPTKQVENKKDNPNESQVTETLSRILFKENVFEPIFVGREREIDLITEFLYSDRIVLEFNGQRGIGKTTLSKHILASQINDNIQGFFIESDPSFISRPWYPIRQLFRQLLKLDTDATISDLIKALENINLEKDDTPYIEKIMGFRDSLPVERSVEYREASISIIRLVLAVCSEKPSLFIFDDVDEYDYPSRFFIDKLIETIHEFPIKVIVTSESRFLEKSAISDSIVLTRFDIEEISPILLQLAAKSTGSWHNLIDTLFSSSMGLPLHIIQGAHLLLEGGSEVNLSLVDLISLRIRRLPSIANTILELVSLYGKKAPIDLIYDFLEHDSHIQKTIEVLIKRGFLYQYSPFTISLSHPIFTEIISSNLTGILKSKYHNFILNYEKKGNGSKYILAKHATKSNDLEQAITYLEEAGDEFVRELDDYGAAKYYKYSYDLSKILSLQGKNVEQFTRLSIKLGDILRYTNKFSDAKDILKEGLLFCEGNQNMEALILSSLARLNMVSQNKTNNNKTHNLLKRAVKLASSSNDINIFYRVFFDMCSIEGDNKEYIKGADVLKEALDYALNTFEDSTKFWRLFLKLSEFEYERGNKKEAKKILMDCLNLIKGGNDTSILAKGRIHFLLGQFFIDSNKKHDAIPHLELATEYLQSIGDRKSAAEASLILAAGDYNKKQNLERAVFLSMQIGWKEGLEKAKQLSSSLN